MIHEAPTPFAEIRDDSGNINKHGLMVDPLTANVVEAEVRRLALSESRERAFPTLPAFVQDALNAAAWENQTEVDIVQSGRRSAAAI